MTEASGSGRPTGKQRAIGRGTESDSVEVIPDTAVDATSRAKRVTDLRTQLNRAYLSGDGAAVERVLALLAAAQDDTDPGTMPGAMADTKEVTRAA